MYMYVLESKWYLLIMKFIDANHTLQVAENMRRRFPPFCRLNLKEHSLSRLPRDRGENVCCRNGARPFRLPSSVNRAVLNSDASRTAREATTQRCSEYRSVKDVV